MVLVVCAVVLAAAVVVVASLGTIPSLAGLSPEEAERAVAAVADRWDVQIVDEEGAPFDSSGENPYEGYEVKSSSPGEGTYAIKWCDQTVQVRIGKTEERLAWEKAEEEKRRQEEIEREKATAKRKEIAEKEIENSLANGWKSEDYVDGESYMLFKAYSDDPAACNRSFGWTMGTSDDSSVSLYKNMAEEAQADIIVGCYTSDGYLFHVYYYPFGGSTEEKLNVSVSEAKKLALEANEFALQHREEYLDALIATIEGHESWSKAEYSVFGDEIVLYLYSIHEGDGVYWGGSPSELEEGLRLRNAWAADIATFANADLVTIRYFSKDGIPLQSGETVTYQRSQSKDGSGASE